MKKFILSNKVQHINVKFHFLRDITEDEVINLFHRKSEDQIADQAIKVPMFQKLRKLLGNFAFEIKVLINFFFLFSLQLKENMLS